jgi:hypothetical protein
MVIGLLEENWAKCKGHPTGQKIFMELPLSANGET